MYELRILQITIYEKRIFTNLRITNTGFGYEYCYEFTPFDSAKGDKKNVILNLFQDLTIHKFQVYAFPSKWPPYPALL